jgi:hypothetical protein
MPDIQTPTLRARDMMTVDDLFIRDGYVLRFSDSRTCFNDRSFATFFAEELNVNIDDPKWSQEGGSKGKRLRYFLRTVDSALAIRTLRALWEYREMFRNRERIKEEVENAHGRLLEVLARLGDTSGPTKQTSSKPTFTHVNYGDLQSALIALTPMPPHERGFAFEKYLKKLFDTFGLEARAPFRMVGEQIDGSFLLGDQTYLVEAKWHNEPTGSSDLRAFAGKFSQRAAWARGLYVSYTGFSPQGLVAFGRADKVICLDGQDLAESLMRQIPLPEVLHRKARYAVEHGATLARVVDLF